MVGRVPWIGDFRSTALAVTGLAPGQVFDIHLPVGCTPDFRDTGGLRPRQGRAGWFFLHEVRRSKMLQIVLIPLILVVVTAVHEFGHWIAIRAKGGHVLRVSLGCGWTLWEREAGATGPAVRVGGLPLGGRIDCSNILPGTSKAVVAVSGAVGNLVLAGLLLVFAHTVPGLTEVVILNEGEGLISFVLRNLGGWFWLVPGAIEEVVRTGRATDLSRGVRRLLELLGSDPFRSLPYVTAATSIIWASLNLIPVPFLRTDGWVFLVNLWRAVRPRAVDGGT